MKRPFIIIDSGFLIALHTKRDKYYEQAVDLCHQIKHRAWISTWPVVTEATHFFIQRNQIKAAALLITMVENHLLELLPIENKHLCVIKSLMLKYQDLPMDLADASLVLLANEIGSGEIVSTDQRDFKTYRWKNHHPFINLIKQD